MRRLSSSHPISPNDARRDDSRPPRMMGTWARGGVALALTIFALACDDDDGMMPNGERPLFESYVAIGNSITAGWQSGGINDSLQRLAYPVLVAQAMGLSPGAGFEIPSLTAPGCPPPYTNIFTLERVGGGGATDCAGPVTPGATPSNLGVPGAKVIDVLSRSDARSSNLPLYDVFHGSATQVEVAETIQPTFVSVWIGNNDALGAATAGDPTLLTSKADFESDYQALAQRIEDMGVVGAVLLSVAQVTNIPHFSPGAAYWVGDQQGAFPPTFSVAANCAPAANGGAGEATLVPFQYGFGVLLAQASQGTAVTLDCLADAEVLTTLEIVDMLAAVARYNVIIQREASSRGWAYVDVNLTLDSLRAGGELPLFPNTQGADALLRPFGDFFSRDGVHPSTMTHELIADHVFDAVNAIYGTSLSR